MPKVVLGIDAGFTHPAFSVVRFRGPPFSLESSEVVFTQCMTTERAPRDERKSVADDDVSRIEIISDALTRLVRDFKPNLVAVELPLSGARSALAIKGMAYSTAIAAVTLRRLGANVIYFTPYDTKRCLTGDPAAEKAQMIEAVNRTWPNIQWPKLKSARRKHEVDIVQAENIADSLATIITVFTLSKF
jgi:Holliday junction resolvasome RuvABC endonuclease subunit